MGRCRRRAGLLSVLFLVAAILASGCPDNEGGLALAWLFGDCDQPDSNGDCPAAWDVELVFEPGRIDFGYVEAGSRGTQTLTMGLLGHGDIEVERIWLDEEAAAFRFDAEEATPFLLGLANGPEMVVEVQHRPEEAREHLGTLRFDTSAGPAVIVLGGCSQYDTCEVDFDGGDDDDSAAR